MSSSDCDDFVPVTKRIRRELSAKLKQEIADICDFSDSAEHLPQKRNLLDLSTSSEDSANGHSASVTPLQHLTSYDDYLDNLPLRLRVHGQRRILRTKLFDSSADSDFSGFGKETDIICSGALVHGVTTVEVHASLDAAEENSSCTSSKF